MRSAVGIPQPVVGVEGYALVIVDLLVEATPVATVLRQTDHTLIGAVERGVEDTALLGSTALDLDLIQGLRPLVAPVLSHEIDLEGLDLPLDVALGLLDADVRHAVAEGHALLSEGEAEGIATCHAIDRREAPRECITHEALRGLSVQLGIEVDTRRVLELLVAEEVLPRSDELPIGRGEDEVMACLSPLEVELIDRTAVRGSIAHTHLGLQQGHLIEVGADALAVVAIA